MLSRGCGTSRVERSVCTVSLCTCVSLYVFVCQLADLEPWALCIVSALLLLVHYVSETSLLEQLARADLRNTAGIGQEFVGCINASDDSASSPPTLFIRQANFHHFSINVVAL